MNSLPSKDWLRLQRFLLGLHSAPGLGELPGAILKGLREAIAYDSASIQDDRGDIRRLPWLYADQSWHPSLTPGAELGVRMMSRWDPAFHLFREAFFAVSAEHHPHTAYYLRTGDGSARRLSDLVGMRALRRSQFYNEISRKNRLRHQLTIFVPIHGAHTLIVAACRESPDFSDRDRAVMELMRPHIANAWRRALDYGRQRGRYRQLAAASNLEDTDFCRDKFRELGLTAREADVVLWVTQGKTNEEIGIILGLTRGTVKFYVGRVLARLGCETRTALARVAMETLNRSAASEFAGFARETDEPGQRLANNPR
ncbi:MAG: helix-turn-helix transcriptional regulator [Verrucomicrobiota bacterium]|nr:helix-turn-helix transcriptional regulator [Verrucomicrobiota bacterium]